MRNRTTSMLAVLAVALGVVTVPAAAAQAAPTRAAAAAVPASVAAMAGPVQKAPPKKKKKKVALTFDDGPSDYTYKVLDVLKKYKVKATFCIVGNNVTNYPLTTARIADEGHRLCNHGFTHADLTTLTEDQVKAEITQGQTALTDATGVTPKVIRFPYGASNPMVRKVAKDLHLRSVGWDVDPEDWRNPTAKTITARILKKTSSGDVVLLHDGGGDRTRTVASLKGTITKLKKKGYTFVLA